MQTSPNTSISSRPITLDGELVRDLIEPESIDELRIWLSTAHRDDLRVLVVGGGTRLAFGNRASDFAVAVSTRRLNRVIAYEPDDMTMAVEPGVTIAQLRQTLEEHGQFVALDVAHPERATIGGSYATGMSGPRRISGGSLKDWVIGVEVMAPDGKVSKAGGMVVKNVTGYDMMHLHYGALGAFGVVTRLNLKVFPRMGASRGAVLRYDGPVAAATAGIALLRSQLQPSSLLVANDDGWRLLVRCDAPESAIDRVVERVLEVARTAAEPRESDMIDDRTAIQPFLAATDLLARPVVARLSISASRQAEALRSLAAGETDSVCADLGSGLMYISGDPSDAWVRSIAAVEPRVTWLALPAALKDGLDVFGPTEPSVEPVIRRLKDAFDGGRQLNAGRFALHL